MNAFNAASRTMADAQDVMHRRALDENSARSDPGVSVSTRK
ncbi:MAG TPA: hypothetical protein VFG15_07000 [Amycolatopsis sp.]|nr:hypothetical protein [Amycolatopsis sp.]